ncbi:MAG: helix-turn-helix domain-containing protein [Bacteroidales bacterium]|nr:helix-turn-helix domain-containing protein [Bacteroidales bacterium]
MKERLKEILSQERLSPARFAELVGVQRSSVSHIISGRNKPSLDFLQKILANFEHISPDWLISGKGPYKRSQASVKADDTAQKSAKPDGRIVFPSVAASAKEEEQPVYNTRKPVFEDKTENKPITENHPDKQTESRSDTMGTDNEETSVKQSEKQVKTIVKTLLFYNDHTFEAFYPE